MIDLSNTLNPTTACGQFTQTLQGQTKIVFSTGSQGQSSLTPLGTTCISSGGGAAMAWLGTDIDCTLANAVTPPTSGASSGYLCMAGTNPIANSRGLDIYFYKDVPYKGKGTIRAGASATDTTVNIEIESNLLPLNDFFPEDSIISLVSSGTVDMGTSSNAQIAAIAFAQGTATFAFQTLIVGSVVAGTIDAGSQVPSIAYEPRIIDNIPIGSPGETDIIDPYLIVEAYERR